MTGKVKEDLELNVREIPSTKHKYVDVNISLDQNGSGRGMVELDGYLEGVILPKIVDNFYYPNITIYPESYPQYVALNLKKANSDSPVFLVRMNAVNIEGIKIEQSVKPVLSGNIVVDVRSGVPNSQFTITLVI